MGIPEADLSRSNPLAGRTGILVATRAAARGLDDILTQCVLYHVPLDCRDDDGLTPLHYAAAGNHPECLKARGFIFSTP